MSKTFNRWTTDFPRFDRADRRVDLQLVWVVSSPLAVSMHGFLVAVKLVGAYPGWLDFFDKIAFLGDVSVDSAAMGVSLGHAAG